ncbi:SGNH/GDSL hydrolase family protein [Geobacillus zalihae]|uniref:SGNH/GDSL hydrolase family protein n=1 Tax=Geobacillus zalihae TaxID=213419 RepID=UPI000763ED38|nr:SGNH/GDSL hydrolase family protein [Geobacillus zalihae]
MAVNKTPNLGLHDWLGTEYVKREEIVENFRKIDNEFGESGRVGNLSNEIGILFDKTVDMPNNILLYGGSYDGVTPNDAAFNAAKMVNRKSDYYGLVYFPNNEVGNAVYYFENTPFLDKTMIVADKGVKLSFPSTNGVSFKKVIFLSDVTIISRDRNNEAVQYANNFPKSLYATLSENPIEVGLKRPKFKDGTNLTFKNYFSDGSPTTAGNVTYYDATLKDTFKSNDTSSPTNLGKFLITETDATVGYIYNCAFKTLNPETNPDVRVGVLCSKDNDHFIFYSLDIDKKLYTGIRNAGWTETVNTKYQNIFTDAYSIKDNVLMSVRVTKLDVLEFYVNGVLVDTVTLPFEISKVGFGINFVNATGSGVWNIYWGKITYGEALKNNVGNPLNVVVFGDSITFGEGSISWAEYLPTFLEGQRGINKVTITNKAVSGERSDQQLTRMQSTDLTPYDMVLILIGTNDIQQGISVNTFSSNVQAMIDLAKSNGRKVVIGIPPMWISQSLTGQGFASANYDKGSLYRAELMKLAAINNCFLADTLSEIGRIGVDNHLSVLRDNLHPNTFGEILLARCFARSIISALTNDVNNVNTSSTTSSVTYYTPTLENGWVNFGSGYADARVVREGNTVRIEGIIKGGTYQGVPNIRLFQLPPNLRPMKNHIFMCQYSGGTWAAQVSTNGDVIISVNPSTAPSWMSLSGITFRVD